MFRNKIKAKIFAGIISLFITVLCGYLFFHNSSPAQAQSTGPNVHGYAWSDTFGWLSLNCKEGGPGVSDICGRSPYGVNIADNGDLSGYAWSDTVGWVSFSATSGCPSGACLGKVSTAGIFSGWAKVVTGGSADGGGWDGWIHLGPSSGFGGLTMDVVKSNHTNISGYAWDANEDKDQIHFPYGIGTGWLMFSGLAWADFNVPGSGLQLLINGQSSVTVQPNDLVTLTYSSPAKIKYTNCKADSPGVAGWNNTTVLKDIASPSFSNDQVNVATSSTATTITYQVSCENTTKSNARETATATVTVSGVQTPITLEGTLQSSGTSVTTTSYASQLDKTVDLQWRSTNGTDAFTSCVGHSTNVSALSGWNTNSAIGNISGPSYMSPIFTNVPIPAPDTIIPYEYWVTCKPFSSVTPVSSNHIFVHASSTNLGDISIPSNITLCKEGSKKITIGNSGTFQNCTVTGNDGVVKNLPVTVSGVDISVFLPSTLSPFKIQCLGLSGASLVHTISINVNSSDSLCTAPDPTINRGKIFFIEN